MISAAIIEQLNTTGEQLIDQLDVDVREIFSMMLGVEITPAQTAATVTHFKNSVTAMVAFAGSYQGMVSVNTSIELALAFASLMLGMEITECDDDVHDALGEITNMVAGSFKHHFEKPGQEVRISTPSVMSGEAYVACVGAIPETLTLMFGHGAEGFLVSVCLESGE